jgi:ParB/RepB/Spo0J family partition protein
MPKMESAGKVRQISLAQIKESKNVRTEYADIEELAESIRTVGLIEPVAGKSLGKNSDGVEEYELVAGYRRPRAFQYLCDKGESFSMIDAVVVQGDKLTIQLVENLQRSDLSPGDREAGIFQLAEAGNGIKEIAFRLSKGEAFVSRNLAAFKVRNYLAGEALKENVRLKKLMDVVKKNKNPDKGIIKQVQDGLEAGEKWLAEIYDLSTQALNEIQGVKKSDLVSMARRLVEGGGTVSCARRLMREYNSKAEPPPLIPPKETEPASAKEGDAEAVAAQGDIDPLAGNTTDDSARGGDAGEGAFDPGKAGEPFAAPQKPAPAKKPAEKPSIRSLDDPPPHKMVDLNSVQVIIKEYIDLIGNTEAGAGYQYKTDAAYEIWAHLLKGL